MVGIYILDGHDVVECRDLVEWGKWFETADRKVAKDTKNDITISTVFLGLDHSSGGGTPIVFETMVFGGEYDGELDRYSTWAKAEVGHKQMCEKTGVQKETT